MTDRAVLLSLAPEFAEKIAAGSKTVELRRRFPDVPVGTWVYLYVTRPVGAILGRARVAEVDVDRPTALWKRHRGEVGLSRERFDEYFNSCSEGFAVGLIAYEALEPVHLDSLRESFGGFVAPQSYRFLNLAEQAVILFTASTVRLQENVS